MPNPNVMMQEMYDRLAYCKHFLKNFTLSKSSRELYLRETRKLERELELPEDQQTPEYNK